MTVGKATAMFKNATGLDTETIKEIIDYAVPNQEWHHAGFLPKQYGGGMDGKYGWFSSYGKSYNMPEYYTGWSFEKPEKLQEFYKL